MNSPSTNARHELERLLSEPIAAALARAASAFDELAGDAPIVLFGAGGLGKKIATGLQALGRPPVAFADNDPARAGTSLVGVPVLSTADAITKYGDSGVFVVAVWRSPATERMSDRIARLQALGAKRVTSFVTLGWKYPEQFLPYYSMDLPHQVLEAKADILRAFDLLADEGSRREYVAHIRLRLHLDFAGLGEPATETEYFAPDVVGVTNDERFVDCGAFDGDTVRSLFSVLPEFSGQVVSFEPDATSFVRLQAWRDSLPQTLASRVRLVNAGVGETRERVSFSDGGGTGSAVGSVGGTGGANAGGFEINVVPLDEEVFDLRPTLVKIDTEGYEPQVLEGARKLITTQAPTLALCVYHRQDHPWRLPLMVASMHAGYRYTLRSYCLDGWDLVLYAVPEGRRTGHSS